MLNRYELKLTPCASRVLIKYLDFMNVPYPDELSDTANSGVLNLAQFEGFPFRLEEPALSIIRYIDDFQGRCLIMDAATVHSRMYAAAWVWMKNSFPCVILCRKDNAEQWIELCKKIWPDKNISAELNELNLDVNLQADIIITQVSNLMGSEYLINKKPKQFIFDNIHHSGVAASEVVALAKNLTLEIYQSLFLMDVSNVYRPNDKNAKPSDAPNMRLANLMSAEIVQNFLHPDNIFTELMNKSWTKIKEYLEEKQYKDYSRDQIMDVLGVNSDLIRYKI